MPQWPVIDGFEFARSGSRLSGSRPAKEFRRLREGLQGGDGMLHWELQGLPQAQGRPALHLRVHGRLQLTCQRCLEPLPFELDAASLLLLYAHEAEVAQLPVDAEAPECIVARKEMPVLGLVEDEVLLALPYAPRHERCGPRVSDAPEPQQRPFAGLRALMGGKR